jgi:uncharacterized membrane protein YphA (DoxX/SURF4 family)
MTYSGNKFLRAVEIVVRIALGGIFVYAAYLKLRDPWALFAMNIESYKVLPLWGVELVARTLPWFEMLVGLLLIAGLFRRTVTTITSILLLVFFSLMVRAYITGQEINCGCFGPGEAISWKTMLRDGSMLAGALYITVRSFLARRMKAPPAEASAPEPAFRA